MALWEKVFYPSPMHTFSSSFALDDASLARATPTQVFSLLIFISRFIDQSHAGLFLAIYIRACDKVAFSPSTHVRTWRTGSYAHADVTNEPIKEQYVPRCRVKLLVTCSVVRFACTLVRRTRCRCS